MRLPVLASCALAALLLPVPAFANRNGLAGYTGKPTSIAPTGESCNQCHSGGTAPAVAFTGPATLAAGTTADYSLVVTTGMSRAAAGIAATDGVKLTPGNGVRDSFGEMVPNGGVAVAGGSATFTFKVTAPLAGAAIKLWAVGLAANGNNNASGDRSAHITKDITVTGGTVADAGTDSGPSTGRDGGEGGEGGSEETDGSVGSGSSTSSSSGGSSGSSGDDGTGEGTGTGTSSSGGTEPEPESSGCNTTGGDATTAWLAAFGIIPLLARRRRLSRR